MKIIETINKYIDTLGKPYFFTTPMYVSTLENGDNHVQISLRVNNKRDRTYYDILVIRSIYDKRDLDIRKTYNEFEHHLYLHLLFNNTTNETLTTLRGTTVKTFRDIMKYITNDEIIPRR